MRRNPISILEKIPHRTWSIHEDNFCKRHNHILGMSSSGEFQSNNETQGEIRIEKLSQTFSPFRDTIDEEIPPPLDRIVDVNTKRKSVIYEVALGRDLAFELMDSMVMDGNCTVVGEVSPQSRAVEKGIMPGDIIIASSTATGYLVQMWTHEGSNVEDVKAALNARFLTSPKVIIHLERPLASIDPKLVPRLQAPYFYKATFKRPIGLHVVEGPNKKVYVQYIQPQLGAARSGMVCVGDEIVEMKSFWGNGLWEVTSVESFMKGVQQCTDSKLTFRFKRTVSIEKLIASNAHENAKAVPNSNALRQKFVETTSVGVDSLSRKGVDESIRSVNTAKKLRAFWEAYKANRDTPRIDSAYIANKIMTLALKLECADIAVEIFEGVFGFNYVDPNPNKGLLKLFSETSEMDSSISWEEASSGGNTGADVNTLLPNIFVCTTALKAYGRTKEVDKALGVLPWMEQKTSEQADVFFMTSLLYVCAKAKKVSMCERIFWQDIPSRNLTYTVATANSLMYLYAKLNRPDDVLAVYEFIKEIGLECTVVTYGVLIKALVRSAKPHLQETAFEVLKSLPLLGINPGIEVYNQMLEYYASTHDYKQTKSLLRLMSHARPQVKPDLVSYGYIITCFADSKKPRSALSAFNQMKKQKIPPNSFMYMGVLKALTAMRDGISTMQVIREMYQNDCPPDKRHYAMAMFCCVVANQCSLAEKIIVTYIKQGRLGPPDVALCTLWLRALLQQGKWEEGNSLLEQMLSRQAKFPKPNQQTYNYLLQYQILDGQWGKALKTLEIILQKYSGSLSRVKMDGSMIGTITSLSYALGPYSAAVVRMNEEDFTASPKQFPMNTGAAPITSPTTLPTDEEAGQGKDSSPQNFDSGTVEGGLNANDQVIYGIDVESDAVTKPDVSTARGSDMGQIHLKDPTEESFQFLVNAFQMVGKYENIFILGSFYTEVLRALLLEGQPKLADSLLKMRRDGGIRLRSDDSLKLVKVEKLAAIAISKGLIVQRI